MFRLMLVLTGALAVGVSAAFAADGKAVYDAKCAMCHGAGVAGAPKLGDKAAWEPRIKTGNEALVQSVIKGKNAMPPRAGMGVSDADAKVAVEYMVGQVK